VELLSLRYLCILLCSKATVEEEDPQVCFLYKPRRFPLDSPQEQNSTPGPLPTMDNIIFYQPPLASTSHPPCLPGEFPASIVSGGPVAAIPVCQTTSQLNQRNEIWKDHIVKYRDMSDLSQKRYSSDQSCRNDTVQEQGTCRDCFHNHCA
jgi:hypothetical protein